MCLRCCCACVRCCRASLPLLGPQHAVYQDAYAAARRATALRCGAGHRRRRRWRPCAGSLRTKMSLSENPGDSVKSDRSAKGTRRTYRRRWACARRTPTRRNIRRPRVRLQGATAAHAARVLPAARLPRPRREAHRGRQGGPEDGGIGAECHQTVGIGHGGARSLKRWPRTARGAARGRAEPSRKATEAR